MSFAMLHALPVGNAVELVLRPPAGAWSWRIQRNATGAFAGPDTPGAARVAEECQYGTVTDIVGLVNGTQYHYRVDYQDANGAWIAGAHDTGSATPMSAFGGEPPDPQMLLRDRLELGLAEEVRRGRLKASAKTGAIDVTMAPFALSDNLAFPTVSVHIDNVAPAEHTVGAVLAPDRQITGGGWRETAGWFSRYTLNVVGVALNAGERARLRAAIARVVIANLQVFDAAGLMLPELHQRDHEDAEVYNAPLYFTIGTFVCLAPVFATGDLGEIESVDVEAVAVPGRLSYP